MQTSLLDSDMIVGERGMSDENMKEFLGSWIVLPDSAACFGTLKGSQVLFFFPSLWALLPSKRLYPSMASLYKSQTLRELYTLFVHDLRQAILVLRRRNCRDSRLKHHAKNVARERLERLIVHQDATLAN